MIGMLLALGALAAWAVIATVELVARDGYGSAPVSSRYGEPADSFTEVRASSVSGDVSVVHTSRESVA